MALLLILVGAPWSLLLYMLPWTLLPWMLPLATTTYHGLELMLIAPAVLNVGLHTLAARRGYDVLLQITRRPLLLITAVAAVAFAVAVPLGAYASSLGGPTTVLLVLVGGLVIPVGVTALGVGCRATTSNLTH